MRTRFVIAIATILTLSALPASAATFTLSQAAFIAANPGLTVIDFEGIAAPGTATAGVSSTTQGDVTFSDSVLRYADSAFASGNVVPTPSDYLFDDVFGEPVRLTFASPVGAIGFNVAPGNTAGNVTVNVFNGATLLDTQTFAANSMTTFNTFAGWYGFGPITHVIVDTDSSHWVNLDNVSFSTASAIPEPGTLLLLGSGVAVALRRRRSSRR